MPPLQKRIKEPTNYIIDIGASTGVNTDPVYNFIINNKFTIHIFIYQGK